MSERFWNYDSLYGNPDLEPEKYTTIHARYEYRPAQNWKFLLDLGYQQIENEIVWNEPNFINSTKRDFGFAAADAQLEFWKFKWGLGGQYTMSDINLTPEYSAWTRLHFHQSILSGALIFDAYGVINYEGSHNNILYEAMLDRFYSNTGIAESFYVFNWKLVATIKSMQIFFEMDNTLSKDYQVVFGYINYLRLFRFGLNWILWN
jgi:outer membrane cobalamin receptor